ncbi:hypothetical protein AB0M20_35890 [Actinoplanes sp. NPDC051633]|uniref:hypothetical protein n=1 Tax=Actinoplanes sp. NPDC051633 TaxID=3155670 RepID=UPI0034267910
MSGCGSGEKPVDPAKGLADLLRVHDALVTAGGWGDAGLSLLDVRRSPCANGDGQTVRVSWVAPTSDPADPLRASASPTDPPGVPAASDRVREAMRAALGALEPGDGHSGDDVRLLGVHATFKDQKDRVHALNSRATIVVSSVGTTLTSACLSVAEAPAPPEAGSVDPPAALAALRRDRAVPGDGWDTSRRVTGPVGPDEALREVDWRLDSAAEALRDGRDGAAREFDDSELVRAVDRTACSSAGLSRVVATVKLLPPRSTYSTDPSVVTAWQQMPDAPWNLSSWIDNVPPFPGKVQPAATTPAGPPVLLGGVEARGGVLLRGTPANTQLQVVGPCAKLATDPVLAAALGLQ